MDDKLADNFIRLIDDSAANGVPEMHFRFWRRADQTARDEYLEAVLDHLDVERLRRTRLFGRRLSGRLVPVPAVLRLGR